LSKSVTQPLTRRGRLAWSLAAVVVTMATVGYVVQQNLTRILCGSPNYSREAGSAPLFSCPFDPYRYLASALLVVATITLVVVAARSKHRQHSLLRVSYLGVLVAILVLISLATGFGLPG
jgi:hypothetical protein